MAIDKTQSSKQWIRVLVARWWGSLILIRALPHGTGSLAGQVSASVQSMGAHGTITCLVINGSNRL